MATSIVEQPVQSVQVAANDADYNSFVSNCDTHYHTKTGKTFAQAGFDPTIIITIFTMLLQMCQKPAAALKQAASTRNIGTVISAQSCTRMALRESYPGIIFVYAKYNGNAIADSVLAAVAATDENKIQLAQNAVGV